MPPTGQIVVGLLGGIACGKSTVASVLRELGAVVIDADKIARAVLRGKDVKSALRARFGKPVFTGTGAIDRRALAECAFASASALKSLNRLVHPLVLRRIREGMKRYAAPPGRAASGGGSARPAGSGARLPARGMIVLDAPLLLEARLDSFCSHLVFVDAPLRTRQRRVLDERGWSASELKRREAFQMALKKKRAVADFVVANTGSLSDTRKQVERFCSTVAPRIRAKAAL